MGFLVKIGILTYHRTLNYGACLQAVATRIVLQKMGHDVYYVDYWPRYHANKYALFSFRLFLSRGIKGACKYLVDLIKNYSAKKKRIRNFNSFFSAYITPFCLPVSESFDVIVYGSDQIWRKQSSLKAYNPAYFGENTFKTSMHVSYAASMGVMPRTKEDYLCVKEMLRSLSKISVREDELLDLVKEMGYSDAVKTLDPTLLLDQSDWNDVFSLEKDEKSDEKYVLFYDLLYGSFDLNEIKLFAQRHGLKLKIISGYAMNTNSADVVSTGNPKMLVSLIKNAEFVFTSSFHGLVFSIIYNKPFYAAFRENEGRAQSLLRNLGSNGKLLKPMQKIENDYEPIDFMTVNGNLNELKKGSLQFLKNIG